MMFEAAQHARSGNLDYFRGLARAELQLLIVGRDEDGRTLLHTAAANGHRALVELLADHGAGKVASKQDDEGWAPLHSAVSAGYEDIVAMLLSIGASVDTTTSGGQTPLHYAASKGHVPLIKLLLQHGAKANAKDATGSTPLHRAASAGRHESVRALLESPDVKIDATDKTGATPLFVAVETKAANCAMLLAARGANLEAANKQEETPLSIAGDMASVLKRAAEGDIEVEG